MARKPIKPVEQKPVVAVDVVTPEQPDLFPETLKQELPEGVVKVHDHGNGIISHDR